MISGKIQQMIDGMPASIAGNLNFSTAEFERRYKDTRTAMKKLNLDILIVCGSTKMYNAQNGNLEYFAGPNIDNSLGANYAIIPANGREFLVTTQGPQLNTFLSTYPRIPIEPIASEQKPGTQNVVNHAVNITQCVMDAGLKNGRIGVASLAMLPTEIYLALNNAFPEVEFVDVIDMINDLRRAKSEEEIVFLQRSAFIADVGMAALVEYVRPGVSINECIKVVDNAMVAAGATANRFLSIGGGNFPDQMEIDTRESPYRFQLGDIVVNKINSEYKGYFTLLSRPISLGKEINDAFKLLVKVNEEVHHQLLSKYRPGAQTNDELNVQANTLTQAISDNLWVSPFSCHTTEIVHSFYENNTKLQPGVSGVLMPWYCLAKDWDGTNFVLPPGHWSGHIWGNTVICTNDQPMVLHQTTMNVVVKTDFEEILPQPTVSREPIHGPGGTWKVSFALPDGMQEKEIRTTDSGAFMDGKPIPFTFDDGAVEFELTVGTPRGPIPLVFKGWMIGDEIAGAYSSKTGAVKGQRNRFKAVR